MLEKKYRLSKKKDFDKVFNDGKSVRGGLLAVKVLENNLPQNRFGFIVSKKVSSKAVLRNQIKRRLRSIVEGFTETILPPKDIIIIALPGIQKEEFLQIQKSVINIFKKI